MKIRFVSFAFVAVLVPAAVFAQSSTALAPLSPVPAVPTASAAPVEAAPSMVRSDVAGVQVNRATNAPLVVNSTSQTGLNMGKGIALMVVGGAGLVAGLIIGDSAGTAVAVAGVAVMVVGLYEYVR